jgi:hypothetical protein
MSGDRFNRRASLEGVALLVLSLAAAAGCSSGSQPRLSGASVDANAVAAKAMELYDANKDGAVDATEAAKCPPLGVSFAEFDADHDGRIASAELLAAIQGMSASGAAVTSFQCNVTYAGRPLEGASVKLVPDAMYGDALLPAQATTDGSGVARPTIGDENLPAKFAGAALLYPGLYRVEITHPQTQLAAKYNTATELGAAVNPASRNGASARFDLK